MREAPEIVGRDRLRVGDWVVDPALNQISRGSQIERLEPKAVEVLLSLARHAGQVMSRDQLVADVWKGIAVSDDALTQSIIKLRKALGDTSKEPAYIQTIPKRGYRLIASVSSINDGGPVPADPPPQSSQRPVQALTRTSWIAAGGGAAAALIIGFASSMLVMQRAQFGPEATPEAVAFAPVQDLPQVVVQPFPELADNPLQILLARGFTARIITDLSRVPELRVISPRIAQKAEAEPAKGPGRYLVTGEIERNDDNIRVYIHLSEATEGRTVWSEQYDRPYTDVFALQDELTRQILGSLRIKLSDAERARQARPYTKSLRAYESFLRAQSALIVRRQAENEEARQLYTRAIELDPNFARAYAGLALTYAADRRNGWASNADAALAKASELVRTAQQIDPDVAEIYFVRAYVAMERGVFTEATGELRTALRLNPSYADAYALLGAIRTYGGRPGETIPLIHTAMKLVPDAGHLYFLILGRAYFFLGDFKSALFYLRQAIARNPESLEVRLFLAATLVQAGRRDDAEWEREEIRQLVPAFRIGDWLKSYPMTDAKQIAQLTAALGSIGL